MSPPPATASWPAEAPDSPANGISPVSPSKLSGRFHNQPLRALLLEGVSDVVPNMLRSATSRGVAIEVETLPSSLSEEELIIRLHNVHILGVRSKTRISAAVIERAPCLIAIGCFCIGVDQIDIAAATARGICVFNSPYANSRSVAEMTLANIITLARRMGDRNREMHQGIWCKTASGSHEVRDRIVGIVGYGHVGSQLSVLVESIGMHVIYHDIAPLMPLGRAHRVESLNALLERADFVTIHVPETPATVGLIRRQEILLMKRGACLLNASRGKVVDVDSLAEALRSGHLGGAAIDVFPEEPARNGSFECVLAGCPNTLLTPHIGGSTEEAQHAIGIEVAAALTAYAAYGSSMGATNFPGLSLRARIDLRRIAVRLSNVHHNVPGVLKEINNLLSPFNIEQQCCESIGNMAYFIADITLPQEHALEEIKNIQKCISLLRASIATRIIY